MDGAHITHASQDAVTVSLEDLKNGWSMDLAESCLISS